MDVGKTLYAPDRKRWRSWLSKNHKTAQDIWLIYFKKESGKKRIPYNDAVEEALCYGWIDSIVKPRDAESWVQRFTPRRKGSPLSELNKERVRRLIKAKKMTRYGLESIRHHMERKLSGKTALKEFTLPKDILRVLKSDPVVWRNFQGFSVSYKRIRIGWIDGVRRRPDVFQQRLRYFIKMTAQNKKFGMVR
ncbi:MAG TPA: YdeI/OmpD-associated family protein [Bacteroidota bacterium]|nr:YdeI/OmpD-associated family protein [Bacteroidota bacterium]